MRVPDDGRGAAHRGAGEAYQAAVFIALYAVRDARLQLHCQPIGRAGMRLERCLLAAEEQLIYAMNLLEAHSAAAGSR